jgi:DNA-binding PadR family transcriptional regulator
MQHDPVVVREILSAFWKVHILHHAAQEPIAGNWMLAELRQHGYNISPGTLYPLLARMHRRGWLERLPANGQHPKAAKLFRCTPQGREVLGTVRQQLRELQDEIG